HRLKLRCGDFSDTALHEGCSGVVIELGDEIVAAGIDGGSVREVLEVHEGRPLEILVHQGSVGWRCDWIDTTRQEQRGDAAMYPLVLPRGRGRYLPRIAIVEIELSGEASDELLGHGGLRFVHCLPGGERHFLGTLHGKMQPEAHALFSAVGTKKR